MKIFVSYGREDSAAARRIYHHLGEHGYDLWFDQESLVPGQRWKEAITAAIRSADVVLVLLSRSSVGRRGYLNREIREALEIVDEIPESRPFLVPVRLNECQPSQMKLSELHRVDMFPDWDSGMRQIRKALELVADLTRAASGGLLRAFLQVQLDAEDRRRIVASVREIPGVLQVDITAGPYDLMVILGVPGVEELESCLAKLRTIRGVTRIIIHMVLPLAAA